MAHDSKEYGVLAIHLLEACVFNGVDDFILECLVHCSFIFVYSTSFVVLRLELVSVGHGGIQWRCGVYFCIGWDGPRWVQEGGVERRLRSDVDVPVVFSSLWCNKG